MQFHQALVEELRIEMQQRGISLDNDAAQMALTCLPDEGDVNPVVRQWLKDSVETVLSNENRFQIMKDWESSHEGQSPFYMGEQ